jgi:hypothetical protein
MAHSSLSKSFGIAIFILSVPPPETSFREIGFVAYSTVISKCIGCPARQALEFRSFIRGLPASPRSELG